MTFSPFSPQKESASLPELCETLVTLLSQGDRPRIDLEYKVLYGSRNFRWMNREALRENKKVREIEGLIEKIWHIENNPLGTQRPIQYDREPGIPYEKVFLGFHVRTRSYYATFDIQIPILPEDADRLFS